MTIPRVYEDLTPQWLTEALRHSNVIKDEVVTDVEVITPLDEYGRHKGNVGRSYQIKLRYNSDSSDAPRTLFVKLSNEDDPLRMLGAYEKEVRFYQDIAPQSNIRVPRCYYSDIDLTSGHHVLLIEDLSKAESGSIFKGYSVKQAEQAIVEIAKFHASWWGSPRVLQAEPSPDIDIAQEIINFQAQWEGCIEKLGCPVPASLQSMHDQIGITIERMYRYNAYSRQTLIHYDFHLENILFPDDGSPPVIIDWQSVDAGRGVYDIVYNLGFSLSIEDRRNHEMRLLRLYHDTLLEHGVSDYSFETCYGDYRLGFFRGLHIFIAIMYFDLFDTDELRARFRDVTLPQLDAFLSDHKIPQNLEQLPGTPHA